MSEGISTSCKKNNEDELLKSILDNSNDSSSGGAPLYKTPSKDSKFYGLESHFNSDVVFYKDVTVHGKFNYNFLKSNSAIFQNLVVVGTSTFFGFADFYDGVYIDDNLNVAGIVTATQKLDVGCGGTVLTASSLTGRVGISTTNPQQKLDVAGSVKIDENIYDSVNNPAKNGYFLSRDALGIRWLPLVAESRPEVPGISTDGIFILNGMIPLYPS